MARSWSQLFSSRTQSASWTAPPPIGEQRQRSLEEKYGARYGRENLAPKRVKPDRKDKGRKGNHDQHGPKHHGKNFDHRNIDGGKNKHGKR